MTEPEPLPGWRGVRDRALTFIEEGSDSSAAGFLELCPLIEGSYDPDGRVMWLTFVCSRYYLEMLEECPEVYDELKNAIHTVIPQRLSDLRIGCRYGTAKALAAFRDAGHLPAQLSAGEST